MINTQTLRELRTLTISLLSRLDDEIARSGANAPPEPTVYAPPPPLIASMTAAAAIKAVLARGPLTIPEMHRAMTMAGNTTKKSTLTVIVCKLATNGEIRRVARGEYALPEVA
jgi:hypothetical protein